MGQLKGGIKPDLTFSHLDHGVDQGMGWMRVTTLRQDPDKMEVMQVGPKSALRNGFPTMLHGAALPLRDQVRSLAALLDTALPLDKQGVTVATSAFSTFGRCASCTFLGKKDLPVVTHALITPRFNDYNVLSMGDPRIWHGNDAWARMQWAGY